MHSPCAARVVSPALALSWMLCLGTSGCDRPPSSVFSQPPSKFSGQHGPPPASIPTAAAEPSQFQPPFRGQVRLLGDLAQAGAPAVLFVQVKPRGQNMPLLIRRYELADPDLPAARDGERAFAFELTVADTMTRQPMVDPLQGELDIEALFDPTGGLTDKRLEVRQRQPLAEGALELVVGR